MRNQKGLSLIELMIAVLISCILILGVTQIFGNTTQTDKTNSALARVQESGRVALEIIGEDARRAGYQGCTSSANTTEVGSVTFPDQAITAAEKSVSFRFATTDNTGTAFGYRKTCDNADLYFRSVTYQQCGNGTSLCQCLSNTNSCASADNKAILDHAVIDAITFAVVTDTTTKWVDSSAVTTDQLAKAHSVRFALTISDPINKITRTYSNTYELRNRL